MNHYCKNHPNKKALSLCHSCGEYFCSDCLKEGSEYYYCEKDNCVIELNKELSKNKNLETKTLILSKESKFIKRIATLFIFINSINFTFLTSKIDLVLSNGNDSSISFPNYSNINIFEFYLAKYMGLVFTLSWLIIGFCLFTSIKVYHLKNRKLFLYALIFQIIVIIIFNIYTYSWLNFIRKTSIVELGIEGYKNFWSIDKFIIAIFSILIIAGIFYIIKKFSSDKIKQEFIKSNA